MTTRKLQLNISGFTDGLNTEASVLNVLPSEFMDGTTNVELLQNGSVRRRRGADFIGESDAGGYLQTIRTDLTSDEVHQESPAVIFVRLPAPNGEIVERIIVDLNNKFYVYEVTFDALSNIDDPYQTIERGDRSAPAQINYNMQFAQSGTKVFFTGRHCQPGYLKLDTDNVTLVATYIDVIIRDSAATVVATPLITQYSKTEVMDNTKTRPTSVEFFAGRIWLGGDPKYPDLMFFSQVIAQDSDMEKFYQEADPFDPTDPNLVDDDGGTIKIAGSGLVYRLLSTSVAMFVGTSLGVWQITGSSGAPFKATDFGVNKVLTDRVLGPENMVRAGSEIVIFGLNSIWASRIERSLAVSTSGIASFISITNKKNRSLWNDIPAASKSRGRALYNEQDSRIYYFYNKEVTSFDLSYALASQPGFTKDVLIFDISFDDELVKAKEDVKRKVDGAFFEYGFADTAVTYQPYIACPFIAPAVSNPSEPVTSLFTGNVLDAAEEIVVATGSPASVDNVVFLTLRRQIDGANTVTQAAFGKLAGSSLQDWASDVTYAASFDSRIISGVQTGGDVLHKKGGTYIFFVFKKVETGVVDGDGVDTNPGGCFVRTAWQWAESSTSAKYGSQYQIYVPDRFNQAIIGGGDDGHSHTWFKHRVRGYGNAMQVILENDGDKDFHLIGWSQQFWGKQD